MHTQSNITNIISPEYITPTRTKKNTKYCPLNHSYLFFTDLLTFVLILHIIGKNNPILFSGAEIREKTTQPQTIQSQTISDLERVYIFTLY